MTSRIFCQNLDPLFPEGFTSLGNFRKFLSLYRVTSLQKVLHSQLSLLHTQTHTQVHTLSITHTHTLFQACLTSGHANTALICAPKTVMRAQKQIGQRKEQRMSHFFV